MRPAYWACIGLESTGLTHSCWVLATLLSRVAGMKEENPAGLAKQKEKVIQMDQPEIQV